MADRSCVIIYGLNELASAVGRMLLLAGYAVAMHEASPPAVLRRKMAFSDAWYDGVAILDNVEARRAICDTDLLTGLRGGMYIPVLTQPSFEAIGRWPWDVVIDARESPAVAGRMGIDTELSIVLGAGAAAGIDCDLVIETGGADPGAVIRKGCATGRWKTDTSLEQPAVAPAEGLFHTEATIGDVVKAGDVLGFVGAIPVAVQEPGRLRGLHRSGHPVQAGEAVAEIAADQTATVSGIGRTHQMIARAVAFTIEMEQRGSPVAVWNEQTGFSRIA